MAVDEALFVKICGITRVEDAIHAVDVGASALGLNLVPGSKRRIDEATARRIVDVARGRVELVLVVADLPVSEMIRLRESLAVDWLQLHGSETPETLRAVLPRAFKAVRIGDAEDVEAARGVVGERLLVDAKVKGELGGAGIAFDWSLVRAFATERRLMLAGGLTPDNVSDAVHLVAPWGVDVASGVESAPGIKDPTKVQAFIESAHRARR